MHIFTKSKHLKAHLNLIKDPGNIGFVPTMGALHKGHLSLIDISLKQNKTTIVSIFVNPTQFNNKEDLNKYPRDLQKDLSLLENFNDQIIIFCPSPGELYGSSVTSESFNFGGIENEMEGAFRPGHFDGVGTVLSLFFNLIQPRNAYFGEKDFQQLQIIKKLVEIKKFDINIIGCPIYREPNGLAFSSRNARLSTESRNSADFIYRILKQAKENFGTKNAIQITEECTKAFHNHHSFDLEYFIIAEVDTLKAASEIKSSKKYRAFIAAFIEGVRLIDNIALN